ncbi:MAG: hypothetical protein AB7J40_03250 [Candidatus Altimarinota bacterium]
MKTNTSLSQALQQITQLISALTEASIILPEKSAEIQRIVRALSGLNPSAEDVQQGVQIVQEALDVQTKKVEDSAKAYLQAEKKRTDLLEELQVMGKEIQEDTDRLVAKKKQFELKMKPTSV